MMLKRTDWIQTYTAKIFYPLEPDIELIDIRDIAHALSLICRFTGHCKHFYSVGQHSILVSKFMPPKYRLEGLLHDAAEAYLNDMARPVKHLNSGYKSAESRLKKLIEHRFGLEDVRDIVREVDDGLLYWEGYYLMPDVSSWSVQRPIFELTEVSFGYLSPSEIEKEFLDILYMGTI
jgi:hypothetical protein